MSIRLITGRPDRNNHLHQKLYLEIGDAINNKVYEKHPLYLIVPEQFTLGSEKALIQALQVPGLIHIDVLSLNRMETRILEEIGNSLNQFVDDHGRLMLMAKAVNSIQDELTIYKKSALRPGFLSQAAEIIAELKENQISCEDFSKTSQKLSGETWLGQKLMEMSRIYECYESMLGSERMDIDKRCELICEGISKSQKFQDAILWMDGFFTFSANDFTIIEALAKQAAEVVMILPGDLNENSPDGDIFDVIRSTSEAMKRIAGKTGHNFRIEKIQDEKEDADPWCTIQNQLYAYDPIPFEKETDSFTISKVLNPWEEACYTAQRIAKNIQENGLHYEDIGILCGDLEKTGSLYVRALQDYGIPAFCDRSIPVSDDPLIEGLLGAIEAVSKNYKTDALYVYAKSGFSALDPIDFGLLENYALARGIKGRKWLRPIESDYEEHWAVERLETHRKILMDPLEILENDLKQVKTYREALISTVSFLASTKVPEKLDEKLSHLIQIGDYEIAGRVNQVWNTLMQVFDQIENVLGEDPFELNTFYQIIKSGVSSYHIGILPARRDVVSITDPFRSRDTAFKRLYVVGANEGILPAEDVGYHLLSEDDRKVLSKIGLSLQDEPNYRRSRMNYCIYNKLMQTTEEIHLSYTLTDDGGESLQPSSLIESFEKCFKKITIKTIRQRGLQEGQVVGQLGTLDAAILQLGDRFHHPTNKALAQEVLQWYEQDKNWEDAAKIGLKALDYIGPGTEKLDPYLVKALYGQTPKVSVSKLEQFNACPFAFYLQHGLKPKASEEYIIKPMEIGTFVHAVIEGCFKKARQQGIPISDMSKNAGESLVNEVVMQVMEKPENAAFTETGTNRFLGHKLRKVSQKTIEILANHLRKGQFDFKYAEYMFSRNICSEGLPEGIQLHGIVDRIDLYHHDGNAYVKIIDYKTGDPDIDYTKIYYGISIQLLVYLQAGLAFMQKIDNDTNVMIPAGTFYFHVDDPLVSTMDVETAEKEINNTFKMKGLFLDDPVVTSALAQDGKNDIYKKTNALSPEMFQALMDYVEDSVKQSVYRILSGDIAISPLKTRKYDPCTYCEFNWICLKNAGLYNDYVRIMPDIDADALFERILPKEGEEPFHELV